jgi:hypothetical protein
VTNIRDAEAIATARSTAPGRARLLLGAQLLRVKLQSRLSQQLTASHPLPSPSRRNGERRRRAAVAPSCPLSYTVLGGRTTHTEHRHLLARPHAASPARADGRDWLAQPQPHRQPHFSESRASNLGVCVPTTAPWVAILAHWQPSQATDRIPPSPTTQARRKSTEHGHDALPSLLVFSNVLLWPNRISKSIAIGLVRHVHAQLLMHTGKWKIVMLELRRSRRAADG